MIKTTFKKCGCGHPSCNQYTLSNQSSVGFNLDDARLYCAAEDLRDALKMARSYIIASGAKHWEKDLAKVDSAIEKSEGGQ